MRKTIKHGLLGLALGAVLAGGAQAQAPMVGEPVPNFTLQELRGGDVSLSDYAGKVTLILFFGFN